MKKLALIAHDGKKADMVAFTIHQKQNLTRFELVGTRSTASLIEAKTGLVVEKVQSGPLGGDAEIAAMVVNKKIDGVIFIVDPLDKHPHDPDIQTLMRVCNVHNVPLALNLATAEMVLKALE